MTRLLRTLTFFGFLLALGPAIAAEPIAVTKEGSLRGAKLDDRGVYVFKGVSYGRSTAGAARFKSPQRVAKWQGVKDALKFGSICPQAGDAGRRTTTPGELLQHSEDCLVLNVWTPGLADNGKRPVMVWLHGRGFYAGAGSEPLYDGARLAKRGDVVVVSVNHRLNVFGYLYLGEAGGKEFSTSGNAGVQDMQLALEWVRDNIAAFGGDSSNVTIFGESGGGVKVSTLLGVPQAKGLFHRGIIESGARTRGMPLATAVKNAQTVMSKLQVKTSRSCRQSRWTSCSPPSRRPAARNRISVPSWTSRICPPTCSSPSQRPARTASRSSSARIATSTRSTRASIPTSAR